jgi:hypothetical protein
MPDLTSLMWTAEPDGNLFADTPEGRKNVGMMANREVAMEAADAHNARVAAEMARTRAARRGVDLSGGIGFQVGDGNRQNNVFG